MNVHNSCYDHVIQSLAEFAPHNDKTTVPNCPGNKKKLRYRKEHSASVVLNWYTLTFLGGKSVDGYQPLLLNCSRKLPNSAK